MFGELMNQPFPGIENITPETELQFRRKAIDRAWKRIKETVKEDRSGLYYLAYLMPADKQGYCRL